MNRSLIIIIPISIVLAIIQSAFFSRIRILGHIPQLLVLAVISWAIVRDLTEGAVWALIGGLCLDLFSVGPLGANSLALIAVAGLAFGVRQVLPRGQYLVPAMLGMVGAVVYLIIHALLAQLNGFSINWDLFQVTASYMVLHALLMIPIYRLLAWAAGALFPDPIDSVVN